MSDWIEKDGKKYYAEEYITFANKNCERQRKIAEEWLAKCTSLSTEYSAVCEAAKRVISSSTPLDDPDPNWCMANIDDLESLERVSGKRA